MDIDKTLFLWINGLSGTNKVIDTVLIFFAEYLIYFVPVLLVYLYVKKRNFFWDMLISISIGLVINNMISLIYYKPRPFVVFNIDTLISHKADSSFPSDHATLFLTIGYLFWKKKKNIFPLIVGFIVGFSRIYCGVHYPADILGSLIISIFSVEVTPKLRKFINKA